MIFEQHFPCSKERFREQAGDKFKELKSIYPLRTLQNGRCQNGDSMVSPEHKVEQREIIDLETSMPQGRDGSQGERTEGPRSAEESNLHINIKVKGSQVRDLCTASTFRWTAWWLCPI